VLHNLVHLATKYLLNIYQAGGLRANSDTQPGRHAKHGLADDSEVLEDEGCWQSRLHSFDYGSFEVRCANGVDGSGEAERNDSVQCEAAQTEEQVRRFPRGNVCLDSIAKAVDLDLN
jgi:hypothetical protein